MEIANETLPKSIEAKEFSALFCRDRHASGSLIIDDIYRNAGSLFACLFITYQDNV